MFLSLPRVDRRAWIGNCDGLFCRGLASNFCCFVSPPSNEQGEHREEGQKKRKGARRGRGTPIRKENRPSSGPSLCSRCAACTLLARFIFARRVRLVLCFGRLPSCTRHKLCTFQFIQAALLLHSIRPSCPPSSTAPAASRAGRQAWPRVCSRPSRCRRGASRRALSSATALAPGVVCVGVCAVLCRQRRLKWQNADHNSHRAMNTPSKKHGQHFLPGSG